MAHDKQTLPTIPIHARAPEKPSANAPCNGCGVCCLVEPCPLGMLLSGRRRGACRVLQWSEDAGRYRCGAVTAPRQAVQAGLPPSLRLLGAPLAWMLARMARRWIAAGVGCDSTITLAPMASLPHD